MFISYQDHHFPIMSISPRGYNNLSDSQDFVASGISRSGRSQAWASGRLTELSQRFVSFEKEVEADAKARRINDDATLEAVAVAVVRVEQNLTESSEKRRSSLGQLQVGLDEMLTTSQRRLENSFLDQYEHVFSLIDALSDRMSTVEQAFSVNSEKYVREMEVESAAVDAELLELSRAHQADVAACQEREMAIAESLAELERRATAKLERDEQLAERKFAQLLRDAQESVRSRDEAQKLFEDHAVVEIREVQQQLSDSIKVRIQADDDIVAALDHYTKELQRAISSVSHCTVQAVLH